MSKIPLKFMSQSTNEFYASLRRRGDGGRWWTFEEFESMAGNKYDANRICYALRNGGWLEGKTGKASGKWYFRLAK